MGMSAGQARLLSITARLTDNEYRTQRLTAARMNLQSVSEDARVEYQDALYQNKFSYVSYNGSGQRETTDLTPTVLYQYQPNKNQYALTNAAGKVLVTDEDAKNFKESDTLADFLDKYGLIDGYQEDIAQYEQDLAQYEIAHPAWQAAYESWQTEHDEWLEGYNAAYEEFENGPLAQWNEGYTAWKENPVSTYGQYLESLDKYNDWSDAIAEYKSAMGAGWQGIERYSSDSEQFIINRPTNWAADDIPCTCYYEAINNLNKDCFYHFLNYTLCYDNNYGANDRTSLTETASCSAGSGYSNTVTKYKVNEGAIHEIFENPNSANYEYHTAFEAMGIQITQNTGDDIRYCDGNDRYYEEVNGLSTTDSKNIIETAIINSRTPTPLEILMSDYVYKPDAQGEEKYNTKKTLKQKILDIYYILENRDKLKENDGANVKDLTLRKLLYGFVNGDLTNTMDKPQEPQYEVERPDFVYRDEPQFEGGEEPYPPVEPKLYTDDKQKAQWYTNLWYRMNGESATQEIQTVTFEIAPTDDDAGQDTVETKYMLDGIGVYKNKFSTNYEIIPANIAKSKDWLNNTLSQGIVALEKVGITRTSSSQELNWSEIIYTNASDIISEEDSNKIALAETKYNQVLNEISIKDKKFESDIKRLDSEHNVLQTEYNSVKTAMDKNIDRSFKVFQG